MQNNLTEIEIAKIEAFNADEVMVEAVRKILLAGIYNHGVLVEGQKHNPLVNGAFSLVSLSPTNPIPDEIIGQQLKAQWAGINALEQAFTSLSSIKSKIESPYEEENKAI